MAGDKGLIEFIEDISKEKNRGMRASFFQKLAAPPSAKTQRQAIYDFFQDNDYTLITLDDCEKLVTAYGNSITQLNVCEKY